jgi:hypothetical protein
MVRRTGLIAMVMIAVVTLAGCTGPPQTGTEVRVAQGALPGGTWSAWAYRSVDSGVCLQIRTEAQDASTLCGIDSNGTSLWRPDVQGVTLVGGTSKDPRAVTVRMTLADGSELRSTVAPAPDVTDLRFFMIPVAGGAQATRVEILDADDTVIDSVPLE